MAQDSIVALEAAEVNATVDLYRAADADLVEAAGLSVAEIGHAVLVTASRIDVLALTRLVGLGLGSTPSDAMLSDALRAFDRTGAPRYFVPVAPVEGHLDLQARLERLGLRHYNNWMRLHRAVGNGKADVPAPSDLEVRQIDRRAADVFGQLVATAFGYPPAIAPLAGQPIGRPNWFHYLAYDRDIPIAAAAMFVSGDAAWFGFAATDAAFRRRGAQSALVSRRLRDAADAGCTWVSVETAEDTVTRDAPSFRNLRRFGFEVAYPRPNYLWTRTT